MPAGRLRTIQDDVLAGLDEDARRDVDEHRPVKLPFREEAHRRQIRLRVLEPCAFRQGPDPVPVLDLIELVHDAVDTFIECHRHRFFVGAGIKRPTKARNVFDALKRIHEPRFAEKQTALNGELIPNQNARACPEALGPALKLTQPSPFPGSFLLELRPCLCWQSSQAAWRRRTGCR